LRKNKKKKRKIKMSFFSKKIIDFGDNAVGLSITDDRVRVAYLEDKIIKNYNSVYLSEGVVVDGEIIDKEKLFSAIDKALGGARPKKIKNKKVRIALPESKSFLRLISIPQMDEKEIDEAIKWEIEGNIPLTLDQVYYDWQLVKDVFIDDGQMKILVLASAKKVVDQHLEILEEYGLDVISIESETTALTRSLINENSANKTSFVINVDKNKTSFLAAVKNVPCFTSSIPISERNIIGAIAKKFNITDQKAEEIERSDGIGSFFEDDALFEAIKPVLDGMIAEIKKTMDFYLEGLQYSETIDDIIICGKLSKAKGLIPYLSRSLNHEVLEGDVRNGIGESAKELPIINKSDSIKYAIAIGLSLNNQ